MSKNETYCLENEDDDVSSEICSSSDERNSYVISKLSTALGKKKVNIKDIEKILRKYECINLKDANNKNNTPLHKAVKRGHVELVGLLLQKGASIGIKNDDGLTPLMLADSCRKYTSKSREEIFSVLYSHKEVNSSGKAPELANVSCDVFQIDNVPEEKKLKSRNNNDQKSPDKLESNERKTNPQNKDNNKFIHPKIKTISEKDGDSVVESLISSLDNPLFDFIDIQYTMEIDFSSLLEKVNRPILIQRTVANSTSVFVKGINNAPCYELGLYSDLTLIDSKKFENLLLNKEEFGIPLLINGINSKILGSFHEPLGSRSIYKISFDIKKQFNGYNLMDWAVYHGDLFLVKYLSLFNWDITTFNMRENTSLGLAVEKGSIETICAMLGISSETTSNMIRPSKVTALNKTCDMDGNTPLILSAKIKNSKILAFLLQLGVEVNETNKNYEAAIDFAWDNEDYDSVLKLLKKDSFIPKECKLENIKKKNASDLLKEYLNARNKLHSEIKHGNLEEVKKLIEKDSSQLYLSQDNHSAMFIAGKEKRWDIYSFFSSVGAKFKSITEEKEFESSLTEKDKEKIQEELNKYIFEVKDSHIIKLVGKSRVYGEIWNAKEIIESFYVYLDKYISDILQVLQYNRDLEIIFDFYSDSTKNMDTDDSRETKGKADYVNGVIKIAAYGSNEEGKRKTEVLGTLAHELTHLALSLLYNNSCNPYHIGADSSELDRITKITLKKIYFNIIEHDIIHINRTFKTVDDIFLCTVKRRLELCITENKVHIDNTLLDGIKSVINKEFINQVLGGRKTVQIDNIVKRVYSEYVLDDWNRELIVRIPHMLAEYGGDQGMKMIQKQIPELFEYYTKNVIQECTNFLRSSSSMKHAITVMEMNNYLGEIKSIESGNIWLLEPLKNDLQPHCLSENLHVIKASSIQLCSIYYYQKLREEHKTLLQQCCLFIKLNYFDKNRIKAMNALKSDACKVMVLISDSLFPCDLDNLSRTFKNIKAKVILILDKNHPYDNCKLTHFAWDDLSVLSKEYLRKKMFHLQGREMSLNQLFDKNVEQLLDSAACAFLIENNDIKIENRNETYDKEYVDRYYVERHFREQTIQCEILKNISNHSVLFISNATKQDLISLGASDNHLLEWQNGDHVFEKGYKIYFLADKSGKNDVKMWSQMYQKISKQKKIHWLHLQQEHLVWKNSSAEISELIEFVDKDVTIERKDDLEYLYENEHKNVIILADESGMGKSTMLAKMAYKLRKKFWVIKLNLIDYISHFKSIDFNENEVDKAIDFVMLMLQFENSFQKCIFKQCCKFTKNVVMIFDGFDEVSIDHQMRLVILLKALKQTSVAQLWITIRSHEKSSLEKDLKVLAYTLNRWTRGDQLEFFNRFWKTKLKDEFKNIDDLRKGQEKLNEIYEAIKQWPMWVAYDNKDLINSSSGCKSKMFSTTDPDKILENIDGSDFSTCAEVLLDHFNMRIHDKEGKLTYVPLHNLMLASAVSENSFKIPKDLNLNDLYDFFVNNKFKIYYEKRKLENENVEDIRNLSENTIRKAHQYEAMKLFLSDYKTSLAVSFEQDPKHVKAPMLQIGLVISSLDSVKFIHRTFAEYFFSEGLIENRGNAYIQRVWLEKILVDENFDVVRRFLNGKIEKEKLPIEFHNDLVEEKMFFKTNKKFGTHFHKLASEGLEFILQLFFETYAEKVAEIISYLNGFCENILHCACLSRNANIVRIILEFADKNLKKESDKFILQRDRSGRTPFYVAVTKNFTEVLEIFCLKKYNYITNKVKKELFFKTNNRARTVLHESVFQGHLPTTKLLCKLSKESLADEKFRRFLTKCDCEAESILHLAVYKGNTNTLDYLWDLLKSELGLKACKDFLTLGNIHKETVLHKAASRGHVEVLEKLFSYASEVYQGDSLKEFLLQNDAFGDTVLHKAAFRGDIKFLSLLLNKYKAILAKSDMKNFMFKCNEKRRTPLYFAAVIGSVDALRIILEYVMQLDSGRTVNDFISMSDEDGDTLLHIAANRGHIDFITEILAKTQHVLDAKTLGKYLQMKNAQENTIFNEAVLKSHSEIITILYDCLKKNLEKESLLKCMFEWNECNGSTLHFATFKGNTIILNQLWDIFKKEITPQYFEMFVKLVNRYNETILHLAAFKGYNSLVEDLFKMAKSMLSKDSLQWFLLKTDCRNENFLHRASLRTNTNVISELQKLGLDNVEEETIRLLLCQTDNGEDTVLHKAVRRCSSSVVKELLFYSKNVLSNKSLKEFLLKNNCYHCTFLHLAILEDYGDCINHLKTFFEQTTFEESFFCEFLSKTDKKWGDTVLHKCAFKSNVDILHKLLDFAQCVLGKESLKNFLVHTNSKGYTALHKAALFGTDIFFQQIYDRTKCLLDESSFLESLTSTNNYGNTILHTAAHRGELKVVKKLCLLVPKECFRNIILKIDKDGDTVFHKSSIKGNVDVLLFLAAFVEENIGESELRDILMRENKNGKSFMDLALNVNDPNLKQRIKEFAVQRGFISETFSI